jgi:DNA-binding transcriptional regulator YbjK
MASDHERPLMEATLRIIGRKGLDGVTHRAVAAEAGMSVGAVTHHFSTRDILVDATLRVALTR